MVEERGLLLLALLGQGIEQGQVMFRRGDRQPRLGPEAGQIAKGRMIPVAHLGLHPGIEGLGPIETAAMTKMMTRLKSDPSKNPITGADLGAGPGAGKTTNGDMGASKTIHTATREVEVNAAYQMKESSDAQ